MQGIDPSDSQETTDLRRNLFIEDAQEYLDLLNVEYATEIDYKNRLNCYWLPLFDGRYSQDISSKEIQRFVNSLSVSEKTKKNILIPLKGVLELAEVSPNPASKVKLKKHQAKRVVRFTPEQKNQILSQLSGDTFLYFAIAFGTGIRPSGEMLALQWDDYDGDRIYVHQSIVRRQLKTTTKTHVARFVIIPEWLKPIMDQHKKAAGKNARWIFLNSEGRYHLDADSFNAAWKKAFESETVKSTGTTYQVPYTCRHTRAAELLSQNVSPAAAAKQLGHSVQMFLNRYSEFIEAYARPEEVDLIRGK